MEQHPGTAKHLCHMPYQHAKHKNPILIKFPHAYAVLARTLGKHQWVGTHAHTYSHICMCMYVCICQSSLRTPQPHSVQQSRHSCCCSTAFLNEFYMFFALPLCFLCATSGDGRRKVGSMQIPVRVKVFAFTLHTLAHTHTYAHTP